MLQRDQVLAPQMIERLKQDRFFDLPHDLRTDTGGACRRCLIRVLDQALSDLLVGDAFFLRPIADRRVRLRCSAAAS